MRTDISKATAALTAAVRQMDAVPTDLLVRRAPVVGEIVKDAEWRVRACGFTTIAAAINAIEHRTTAAFVARMGFDTLL